MVAQLIDGKKVAAGVHEEVAREVAALTARGRVPGLGVVLVGADPASRVYVGMKRKACKKLGIHSVAGLVKYAIRNHLTGLDG